MRDRIVSRLDAAKIWLNPSLSVDMMQRRGRQMPLTSSVITCLQCVSRRWLLRFGVQFWRWANDMSSVCAQPLFEQVHQTYRRQLRTELHHLMTSCSALTWQADNNCDPVSTGTGRRKCFAAEVAILRGVLPQSTPYQAILATTAIAPPRHGQQSLQAHPPQRSGQQLCQHAIPALCVE